MLNLNYNQLLILRIDYISVCVYSQVMKMETFEAMPRSVIAYWIDRRHLYKPDTQF
jgi:hypothetical protein